MTGDPAVPIGCALTPSELAVMRLLATGLTYKQIAAERGTGWTTVRTQCHNAYRRLGVHSGPEAVVRCWHAGWIDDDAYARIPTESIDVLRDALRNVADAIRASHEPPVPGAQRRYLDAFDQLLHARTRQDRDAARNAMTAALRPLLAENGVLPIGRPQHRNKGLAALLDEVQ